jgi:NADH-quinone oxidoreductase subunit M
MLWMYQRTFLGKTTSYTVNFPDLRPRDWAPLLPLFALIFWLGTYTQSFMPPISSATARILDQSRRNQEYQVKLVTPAAPNVQEAAIAH